MADITKKAKKTLNKTKKRAIILSFLAFGGLSIGSLGFLPFLMKTWNTLQYNIVDFKHINRDNAAYELEFALSDFDAYKLNYQDLNVDFTLDKEGKQVVTSHKATYDDFSRSWKINSNYDGLNFGKRYYLKVYLDAKNQKRFAAKKVISFGENVVNFVDTPPAVRTINFETKTPSTASVSLKFADESANLEGKKVALEYYYVLKNQSNDLEDKLSDTHTHTSYVDSSVVKNGVAEFNLKNLYPGLDYRISAIRYIDKQNTSQIPLVPMQKIALDSEIDYKRQGNEAKKSLFEQTTGKIRVIAASLIDQNLSYQQKRMTITFQNLDPSVSLENKVIKMFYKNALTGKEFTTSGTFLSNLVTFDLKNLDPGSKYYITKFELDSAKVDFSDTFVKNFYTPAAIVDSKTQVGATYANIELTVVSVDDLTKTTAFLYLDNTAVIPPLAKFIKTEKENTYKINLTPKELTNATKYNLNRLVLQSQVPDSVFAKAKDGYNYFTIPWINQLEVASLKRNFVTSISDLKTFIKLEPRVTASKVEYTLGFGLDSSFLNDKNLVLHYYKKGDPSEKYVSRPAIAEGSEIRFELNEFSGSTTYKLDKITIEGYPDLAVAIKYDQNKKSDQGLNFDEFFTKYFVSKIDFAEITETSAKVNVVISGDFKNSIYKQSSNSQSFKAKLIFGQPGFTNLSKTIDINLASQDENFTLTQDELLFHFKLDNLDPKTKYKVADLEVIGKSNLFDLENIINLDAEFSTAFQRVKVLGSNFDQITEKTATANIYFDPVFNNFLNGLKFKAKFKDETNKIVAYPSNSYHEIKNNRLKVELVNLEPGKKYTFVGLESDPEQEKGLENLTFEYFDQKDQTKTILPPFFYTVPKIAAIKSEPKQDSSKITVDFGISDPNFGKRPNSSDKNAIIFVKNNATGATSSATAKILFKEQKNIAEFNLENLKKLSHHTITQILVDSQKINYSENLEDEKAAQRNFNTVATTASVVKVLQTKKEFNKIGLKLSFDPIKDNFIKNDQIQVALINKTDNSTAEATGTVSDSLVLDLEFTNNIKPGSEYTISKLTNLTKDKNIQTSVGFEFKKAENYSPDLSGDNKNEKIYSSLEVKSFSVLKNENETVKVKLEFTDAEKALLSTTKPTISLLLKNSQTNEILTATTQAKEEDGKITAEFSFENLERNQKYVLVSVNDFSSAAPQFHLNSDLSSEDKKSFYVNVDKIEVKNIVYSNIKSTSVKAEIFFDPIKDHYLAEKEIEVEITKDEDPAAKFVSVATQVQGTPITRKKVKIIKLDDNRLRAEVEFENLDEGTDFKIKLLKLAKNAIHTNNKNVETGPKFEIVDEFVSSVAASSPDKKIGQIDDNSKQKTLKFATDIVISDIKINENNSSDKQRSAEIKIDFTNSNNEILKLKKDQVVTITLINKQTGKLILTSAKVVAEESTQGNKKTAASATFNFQNNLDKLTKYEISSVSVVRRNGVYPIPFSTKISQEKKSFSTQINSVTVKNIFYRDISKTSVELTTVFDFIEDNILNDQFEAELEYELEKPQGQNSILKTSKVEITNNRAIFIIENLDEATGYKVKDLKLTKKTLVRRARSLRTRRSIQDENTGNISVNFDKTEVEQTNKKLFATKSLISEIKLDPNLIQLPQGAQVTFDKTALSDTSAGLELKIKDPKEFFKNYQARSHEIKLLVKSKRTGAIAEVGSDFSYDSGNKFAILKFKFDNLEKYTVYEVVDIFLNGVPVGFLGTLTQQQRQFRTTAKEVLPELISQIEFKKHGAVVRMVFDVFKNWFLVDNKVKITFKKLGNQTQDDPELTAEAKVESNGFAVFNIDKENIKNKVPQGTRFEISKLEFVPEIRDNQKIVKDFPLDKIAAVDQEKILTTSQTQNAVTVLDSNQKQLQQPKITQFQDVQVQQTENNADFADVNLRTSPLIGQTQQNSQPKLKTTFDTAAYITNVEKISLADKNAEIKITINSTLLLDNQNQGTMKLKYIDISTGQEYNSSLNGQPVRGASTAEYTFLASNLTPLNYYQLVSVTYENASKVEQTITFDENQVNYQDRLFRTTPISFQVTSIESTFNKINKTANVKLQLDDKAPQYLEGYYVLVSYQRIDKTSSNTPISTVEGQINSDGSVDIVLEDKYSNSQKSIQLPEITTNLAQINDETNTLNQKLRLQNPENTVNRTSKTVETNKLFDTFNYKITKVELKSKPHDSSQASRVRRSLSTSLLIEKNNNFARQADFKTDASTQTTKINETQIIKTNPISIYDQLIFTEEKDKSSGIDTTIYAYFISSDELSETDADKKHFSVQLYNKTLKKYELVTKASEIKKLNATGNKSHFYVVSFETNLNKASLYNIEHFVYKDQKIETSDYKTQRVAKTEFTTPGKKAWLTNFSQVGAYENEAASVIFQFDEKDEYLWRNKHKIELDIHEVPQSGSASSSTKFTFVPTGPITRVKLDNTSSKDQTLQTSLSPNKTYEIRNFTIKEVETPQTSQPPLSDTQSTLKIKTIDAQNTANPTELGQNKMEVAKVDSSEVKKSMLDQKIPFFETKAQFNYTESVNFKQDDDENADGKSATLEFNFNNKFLQIPSSYATITIAPAESSSTQPQQKEVTFISENQYDSSNGKITFKLNNLDRFHTYKITNFEIGGEKIDPFVALKAQVGAGSTSSKLEFTPVVQKIYLSDLEVEDLRTGTNEVPQSLNSKQPQTSQDGGATKEDGSKVFGKIKLYFDKNDSWLENSKLEIKIKDKNQNTDIATINDVSVTKDTLKPSTPYKAEIDLNSQDQIQPGSKIAFEFKIKEVGQATNLKGKSPEDIKIEVPERQYNLDYAPKLETDVVIPPVIESVVFSELKDTTAKLKIKLKGDPRNFERVTDNPIVLSIQPDPKNETKGKIPISLIKISQVTKFKDKSKFEIEYNLENLIPNVEYKILKLQGQDLEIPFGEEQYKLKLAQSKGKKKTTTPEDASATEKTFKTTFSELQPEKIFLTQSDKTQTSSTSQEYQSENLTLNLDPVSMWSLAGKKIKVKFKPQGPKGEELKQPAENSQEKEYEFTVNSDISKKTLEAKLTNQQVTDNKDNNFFPSTTYKITKIETVETNRANKISLNLTDSSQQKTNNLQFTTQLAQPPLKEVKISNFYNKQGLDDTFEQHIYFAFDDPYRAIDESSIKDWKLILEGTTDKNKNNNATDASSWEQVAKYEPESASSNGVVLFNPRELDAPEFQYNEDPELQRILVEQQRLEDQIKIIEEEIKNFDTQENKRVELIKKIASSQYQNDFQRELTNERTQIKGVIEKRKEELEKRKEELEKIQLYLDFQQQENQSNSKITEDKQNNPYRRYFAFTLKGNASWLKYYKMRVAIQYKYFKDNDNRSASEFAKLITQKNQNQTQNSNQKTQAYATPSQGSASAVSRISTLELVDFEKYTNRVLLKKSEIKPLNEKAAYIEMEFEDPKKILKNLTSKFSRTAKIDGKDDLDQWIQLTSKYSVYVNESIKEKANRQYNYNVDTSNDDGKITNSEPSNKWNIAGNTVDKLPNLDFDVNAYKYELKNPFSELLASADAANKNYIDLVNKIPKSVIPTGNLIKNTIHQKNYTLNLAKVDISGTTIKIGLIITYYWADPTTFAQKIFTILPKTLNGETNKEQTDKIYNEPLIPRFSKNINLTFMTSPIVGKEDPYWGNFWANSSGDVWHSSGIRKYDERKGQGNLINDEFGKSLFSKLWNSQNNMWNYKYSDALFLGPTTPIKKLSKDSPIESDDNYDRSITHKYSNKMIKNWIDDTRTNSGKTKTPFGIQSTSYNAESKSFKISFFIPGSPKRIQEIVPTVSYAVFLNQSGKIYLFGNKNGGPIRLDNDLDLNSKSIIVDLAPLSWSKHELPETGTNLSFVGLISFPYLPPNPAKNYFFQKHNVKFFHENRHFIKQNLGVAPNQQIDHKYLLPVESYRDLTIDAENPYFVPWVANDDAWNQIVY